MSALTKRFDTGGVTDMSVPYVLASRPDVFAQDRDASSEPGRPVRSKRIRRKS